MDDDDDVLANNNGYGGMKLFREENEEHIY